MNAPKIFKFIIFIALLIGICNFKFVEAAPMEISPHIFIDQVDKEHWFLNGDSKIIFVGNGSPLFPDKKSHYIDYDSIKYGTLNDGRFIITCFFHDMYEFAVFYKGEIGDDSRRARFMMRDTVDSNTSPYEIDSVLAEFNGQYLEPFPAVGTNLIPYRVAEMLYYIVKGQKFYGDLNPALFIDESNQNIVNPYTQDLYERCDVARSNS
ncbi:MAG: hypothetical protein IJS29_05575 [Selenomonadaceae bacterium]|nr:hypothetical protein [Selenomonadaceae bacterium]